VGSEPSFKPLLVRGGAVPAPAVEYLLPPPSQAALTPSRSRTYLDASSEVSRKVSFEEPARIDGRVNCETSAEDGLMIARGARDAGILSPSKEATLLEGSNQWPATVCHVLRELRTPHRTAAPTLKIACAQARRRKRAVETCKKLRMNSRTCELTARFVCNSASKG